MGQRMLIYLDTMLWNRLCDEDAEPAQIIEQLSKKNAQVVLSTQIIYELAKTFTSKKTAARDRAIRLFSFLVPFAKLRTPCMKMNPTILVEEAHFSVGGQHSIEVFLPENDYRNMEREVEKLSQGIFEPRVGSFIASREKQAADLRFGTVNHLAKVAPRQRNLLTSAEDNKAWFTRMLRIFGRQLIREHLILQFPAEPLKRMTLVAKRLIASRACRLSHAVVAADLYVYSRAARNQAVPRDLLPDLDHMVNASHCDMYLTAEAGQGKYGPLILRNTTLAVYDQSTPVRDWLISIIRETP
jgi:hypothetical protein